MGKKIDRNRQRSVLVLRAFLTKTKKVVIFDEIYEFVTDVDALEHFHEAVDLQTTGQCCMLA